MNKAFQPVVTFSVVCISMDLCALGVPEVMLLISTTSSGVSGRILHSTKVIGFAKSRRTSLRKIWQYIPSCSSSRVNMRTSGLPYKDAKNVWMEFLMLMSARDFFKYDGFEAGTL